MKLRPVLALVALLALAATPRTSLAQDSTSGPRPSWPFAVGERMVFDGKFGFLPVGSAEVRVEAIDTVRGHETFRVGFSVRGGPRWFGVHDSYTSWFDTRTLVSYRYHQDIHEGRYNRNRKYEILPSQGIYVLDGKDTSRTVALPLDDESFLYFLRTVPLELGQKYTWNRYFAADRNPVIVEVVRREEIEVPAGKFTCLVLRPTIKTSGIFAEGGHAEVWISDDDRRLIVQMKSGLKFGSLNLYLREYSAGPTTAQDR
ncbi:MAG TPA: DUF3108 domain-containing protein [Gemmatimonadaceae bacterium]|nr:DUF3108 domain-containing protein [Gemmatimonadaceae bacterium]